MTKESIEQELKNINKELEEVQSLIDKEEVFQMAMKILVNSAYGSLSLLSNNFAGSKELFSNAVTSSARISNLLAGRTNSEVISKLLNEEPSETQLGYKNHLDHIAQIDTDSVAGDSIVYINGERMKIEDLFENSQGTIEKRGSNNFIKHVKNNTLFDTSLSTLSLNKNTGIVENKKIKYIMAHKVKKRMFKIKHKDSEIIVTEDHSVIIKRNEEYLDIKPKDIIKGDKIIKIYKSCSILETLDFIIEDLGIQEQWVYDIEVEDNHNFFANNICVHNSNYVSIEPVIKKKFGDNYEEQGLDRIREFSLNYIDKVSLPETYKALKKLSNILNSYLPEKLKEDKEILSDCLPGEALIKTNKGDIPIREIVSNIDKFKVLSYNEELKINEFKKITNMNIKKTKNKMLTISDGVNTFRCTENHLIYTRNRGYIEAKLIREDDDLILYK